MSKNIALELERDALNRVMNKDVRKFPDYCQTTGTHQQLSAKHTGPMPLEIAGSRNARPLQSTETRTEVDDSYRLLREFLAAATLPFTYRADHDLDQLSIAVVCCA